MLTPEIPLSELQKYVGRYGDAAGANEFAILIRNQRLAVRLPNNTSFDLLPPDANGRRATRANVGLGVTFEESQTGAVSAMNFHRPGAAPVMRLTPVASTLPTVDEIMKLRRIPAASAILTMRTTGSIRFPQSAVQGRFSSSTAGDDRLRIDINLDTSLQIRTALNKGRASAAVSGASTRDLTGKMLAQTRLGHPSVLFGDWRKYFDAVRVVRAGALGGRKVYGIQLESAGLPPTLVAVDAETGDVLQDRRTMSFAEAGAMLVTTTYSDYRDIGGMRVPHRYVESNDLIGRTIYEVERVEVGVTLAPEIFTLQPLTASGGGRQEGIARHQVASGDHLAYDASPVPFETTRWSLVLAAAGNDSHAAREALSSLCQTYWYPLYAYIRRRGLDPEDARDLTQGFLTSLIERQDFEGLRQDRGRFRAFLLASLKHYLSNWSARERTQKRGGGWQMVPLENAEGLYVVEPVNHATPETLFERRWALTVVDGLLADLRAQWTAQGRASEFDELKACLLGQAPAGGYAAVAARLGDVGGRGQSRGPSSQTPVSIPVAPARRGNRCGWTGRRRRDPSSHSGVECVTPGDGSV